MVAISVQLPFPVFTDADGQPVEGGYVWIGQANQDPRLHPINVYFDKNLLIPAGQPLRTVGGYIVHNGSPAQLFVDGNDYSILVQNRKGIDIYYFPSGIVNAATAATATKLQTARTLTIGNTGKSVDGSADVSWSLDEIGAARFGIIASGTNLNTVVSPGFYRLNNLLVNAPSNVDWGQLIVARGGGESILQIVTGYNNGQIFWRQGSPPDVGGSGSWSAWHEFFHTGNLGAASETASGIVELATAAEVRAGTDNTRAVTPQGIAAYVGALSFRNKLINAAFTINQRSYTSGAATTSANQYTLDRWRVVTSGQNLSWSGTAPNITITAPAGGVEQVIEGIWIEGGTYTLSWTGNATATVNGSAVANGGTVSLPAGNNVTVRFSGGTVSKPQLELGSYATMFEHRHFSLELMLCQRYYETLAIYQRGYVLPGSEMLGMAYNFRVTKRAVPTVTLNLIYKNTRYAAVYDATVNGFVVRADVINFDDTIYNGGAFASAEL